MTSEWVAPPEPGESLPAVEHIEPSEPTTKPSKAAKVKSSKFPKPKAAAGPGVGVFVFQVFEVASDIGVTVVQSAQELVAIIVGGIAAWYAPDEWAEKAGKVWRGWTD